MGLDLLDVFFKHKGKDVSKKDIKYGLKMMESSGGKNTKDRYEPRYHKELIRKKDIKDNTKWYPTPAEKKYIAEVGEDKALKEFSTSKGEYQILPETAYRYTSFVGRPDDLNKPEVGEKVADELLEKFHKEEGGDLEKTIKRWNQGSDYLPKFKKFMKDKGLDLSMLNPFASEAHAAELPTKLGLKGDREFLNQFITRPDEVTAEEVKPNKLGLKGDINYLTQFITSRETLDPKDSLSIGEKVLTSEPINNAISAVSSAINFFKKDEEESIKDRPTPQLISADSEKAKIPVGEEEREELLKGGYKPKQSTINLYSGVPSYLDSFAQGILPIRPKELQQTGYDNPFSEALGSLTGIIAAGGMTAGVAPAVSGAKYLEALPKVAQIIAGRMAQTGSTFGVKTLADNIAMAVGGEDINAVEASKETIKSAAFGAGLGAVGAIPAPLLRIPAEASYGFSTAKLEGADNLEAGIQGAMFGLFGLFNTKNLAYAYKNAAEQGAKKAMVDRLVKLGADKGKAAEITERYFRYAYSKTGGFDAQKIKNFDQFRKVMRKEGKIFLPDEGIIAKARAKKADTEAYQAWQKERGMLAKPLTEKEIAIEKVPLHPAGEGKAAVKDIEVRTPDDSIAYQKKLQEMATPELIATFDVPLHPAPKGEISSYDKETILKRDVEASEKERIEKEKEQLKIEGGGEKLKLPYDPGLPVGVTKEGEGFTVKGIKSVKTKGGQPLRPSPDFEKIKADLGDVSGYTTEAQKGGELFGVEEGKLRTSSGNLPSVQDAGGPKRAQEILDKAIKDSSDGKKISGTAQTILNEWRSLQNINTAEKANNDSLDQLKDLHPEITDQEIAEIQEEIDRKDLWDEERLERASEKYLAKKEGSAEGEGKVVPEEKIDEGDRVVYHGGTYKVGEKVKQKSGYYPGLYLAEQKGIAFEHGDVSEFSLEKGIKLYDMESPLGGKKLKEEAQKAGYVTTEGSGFQESEYLKTLGYDGIQRKWEIILFSPENVLKERVILEEKVKEAGDVKEDIKGVPSKEQAEVGEIKIDDLDKLPDETLKEVINSGKHMGITKKKARRILNTRAEDKLRESFPIEISMNDIPYEKAYQAYSNISFSPEKRAETTQKDYLNTMESFYEDLKPLAKTDEQKNILISELTSFKEGYIKRELAVLSAKGRTLSSMITGPAKFPTARNQKALNVEKNRVDELLDFIKKADTRARRKINQQEIEDRGGELEVAKQELKKEEKNLQMMKDINKLVRKKGIKKDSQVKEIIKITGWKEKTVEKLFEPDYSGRVGFPGFELTSKNSRIKRLREKIASMEKAESLTGDENIVEYEGAKAINNFDEERVQLLFDEKPTDEIRKDLKSSGWRWSPRQKVWQRKNTLNGISAAKEILAKHFKKDIPSKLLDKKGQVTIPFEWEANIPTKEVSGDAFQDHVDYLENLQLPEGSKIKEIKKQMQSVNGKRLAGKLTPSEANSQLARLRGDLIREAIGEGVSIVRTKKGKLKIGMREKSGIFVPANFSEYGKFKDFEQRLGGVVDTARMLQEIDGSLSVREKVGTEGQAGPVERYIGWRTRDISIQKLNFNEQWSVKLNKIFHGIKPDTKEDHALTKALESGEDTGLNPIMAKKADALRKFYDALLDHQNVLREMRGQDPIPFRHNYSPQILADSVVWSQLFNKNKESGEIQKDAFIPDYVMPNKPYNPREMARKGDMPYDLMLKSSYELAKRYLQTAEKDIFNTTIIQNNKAFISQLESLGKKKAADALAKWNAEGYAGVKANIDRILNLPESVNSVLRKTNAIRNLAVFPFRLAFNTGNQIKSLSFTVSRYGYLDTMNGLLQYMNPKNREQLRDIYSFRVKTVRAGRVSKQDNNNTLDGIIDEKRSAVDRWNDAGTFILEEMEKLLTGSSVFAAYNQGNRRGLKGESLNQFASDGGGKTQSMYNNEDRPGILRNLIVKSVAPYQTFKFELLNSIRELSGKTGTPPDDRREAVAMFLRFVSAALVMRLVADWASKKDFREFINPLPFAQWTSDPIVDEVLEKKQYGHNNALPSFTGMAVELTGGVVKSIKNKEVDRKLRNTLIKYVPGMFGVGGGMQASNMVDTLVAYSQGGIYNRAGKLMFRVENEDIARGMYSGVWTTVGGREYKEKKFVQPKAIRDLPFRYGVFGRMHLYPTTKAKFNKIPDSMKKGSDKYPKVLLKTEKTPRTVIFIDTPSGKKRADKIIEKAKKKISEDRKKKK